MHRSDSSVMEHEKIERLRDRMLQCPICMDEYKDPRILTCHHTVCLSCLLDYVHASSTSGRLFRPWQKLSMYYHTKSQIIKYVRENAIRVCTETQNCDSNEKW
ncbi:hypothetical protein ACF0H5_018435 [Mactra antiquata]